MLKSRLPLLFKPIDSASLVFFRIAFGFLMLVEVWRYLGKGWVKRYYIQPDFLFPYSGFDWIQPWPGDWMYAHFYVMGVLAIGIMIGFCYRICAVLFFLCFTHVFLLDQTRYLNHFYLVSLVSFLMIWVSPHRAFSVDAKLFPKKASDTVPGWMTFLLTAQMGIVYFYGGIAKISGDWLAGRPLDKWLSGEDDFPVIGPLIAMEHAPLFFAWSGLLLDLLAAPFLIWRRTRMTMFLFLVTFHLMNVRLFNIGIFPWLAIGTTTLFLNPSWPRKIFNWPGSRPEACEVFPVIRRPIVVLLSMFLVLQCLIPLRHHLFPGDVAWTEEGHYFSWRMKLRQKRGKVVYTVRDNDTGRVTRIRNGQYLTGKQESKMSGRPHMIHRFARHLAREARAEGRSVTVTVDARASLNSRPLSVLIDPEVDLGSEPYRFFSANPWILPMGESIETSLPEVQRGGAIEVPSKPR